MKVRLLVVTVLVLIAGIAIADWRSSEERPTDSFCLALHDVEGRLADVEAVTTRTNGQTEEDLGIYRGVLGLVWTDRVASGGPVGTEQDAVQVVTAIRAAIEADDPGSIRTPDVRAAARRLAPQAADACEGKGV
jgi:hypothetical protein